MLLMMLAKMLRFETVQQSDAVCTHFAESPINWTRGRFLLLVGGVCDLQGEIGRFL